MRDANAEIARRDEARVGRRVDDQGAVMVAGRLSRPPLAAMTELGRALEINATIAYAARTLKTRYKYDWDGRGALPVRPDAYDLLRFWAAKCPGIFRPTGLSFEGVRLHPNGTLAVELASNTSVGEHRKLILNFVSGDTVVATRLSSGGARLERVIDASSHHPEVLAAIEEVVAWTRGDVG